MVEIPGLGAVANVGREVVTSTLGNSFSDVLKVAGQGKTILIGMEEALVHNMENRLAPLMKYTREQFLEVEMKNIVASVNTAFDDLFKDADGKYTDKKRDAEGKVIPGTQKLITPEEVIKIKEQFISAAKSQNLYKSVEDKADMYLKYIRGNESAIKDPAVLANFLPHELDLAAVEAWHHNRGNVRMARAAINEMQTFSQAQNAFIYHAIDCGLVSPKFREFFEKMASVIDLFEPMSQAEGDKFRMANVKWADASKEYEVELEKKYNSFTLEQKQLAVYFTTQAQSSWNEYLGAGGANALHKGVGSAFAHILQFRTFLMREVMEEVSVNLLRAYEKNAEIDISRTAQAVSFNDEIDRGRVKKWNCREFFQEKYGIQNPGNNASREEVLQAMSKITKAMLLDGGLHVAHVKAQEGKQNRGWALIEGNRKFMHCLVKLRVDLHPALAYRADGDGTGKSPIKVSWKSASSVSGHNISLGNMAMSETGESAYVKDIMPTFEFSNEHFFKSFMDQAAPLKTGSTAKTLIEESFSIMTITSLTHYDQHDANLARAKFLSANKYEVYDTLPPMYLLPQAHKPHIDIAGKDKSAIQDLKQKLYTQMLLDLPELPRGADREGRIWDAHRGFKTEYLSSNNRGMYVDRDGIVGFNDGELKLLIEGKDKIKTDRVVGQELDEVHQASPGREKNITLYLNIPNRKSVLKLMVPTLEGMPWKDIYGRGSNLFSRKNENFVDRWIFDPKPNSATGKLLQNIDSNIDAQKERAEDPQNTPAEVRTARVRRSVYETARKAVRYSPVIAITGAAMIIFPVTAPFVAAGVSGFATYKYSNKGLKALTNKLNQSRFVKGLIFAISGALGASAGLNVHQAASPDAQLLKDDENANKALKTVLADPNKTNKFPAPESQEFEIPKNTAIMLNDKVYQANKDLQIKIEKGDEVSFAGGNLVAVKRPGSKITMVEEFRVPFKWKGLPGVEIKGFSKDY